MILIDRVENHIVMSLLCSHHDYTEHVFPMMNPSVVSGSSLLQKAALHLPDGANHKASTMRYNQQYIHNLCRGCIIAQDIEGKNNN